MKILDLTPSFILEHPILTGGVIFDSAIRNIGAEIYVWVAILVCLALPIVVGFKKSSSNPCFIIKNYKTKNFRVDALYAFFDLSHISHAFFIIPATLGIGKILEANFSNFALDYFDDKPVWLQLCVLFVIIDLAVYFWHRLQHSNIIIWQFHKVHHSQEIMSGLTVFRKTILDRLLDLFVLTIPAFVLSIDYTYPIYILIITNIHQLLIHTGVGVSFGILDKIIVSPSFHEHHHSKNKKHLHCNYGSALSIWDHIFGTFVPNTNETLEYGIQNEVVPESFLKQIFVPLIGVYDLIKKYIRFRRTS
jgi:sterol desaturase/sphingolipid hydroxylase (fatty acid hydroxylase superfamily)